MDERYDVVVVGAGVVGCAIADTLARGRDVLVIDRDGVAAGATGRAAGLVTPTLFYGDLPPVARHANAFFRRFDGTNGFSFTERRRYDLVPPAEEETARDWAGRLAAADFPVTYVDAERLATEAPRLDGESFAGAVRYDDAGWVDPYALATALAERAVARGATVETGRTATAVDGTRVVLADRVVEADAVVVAAGWRTPGLVEAALPLQAYRTQCAVLEPTTPLADDFPVGRVGSEHLYFRPEHNGDLLVGGGQELVDDPAAASRQADESFVETVARAVPRLVDGFEDARFVNGWAGVDSASPDARPILDRVAGVVVASGFNGLGVLAAPIAAEVARSLVVADATPAFDPTPFALDRFADPTEPFELRSTAELNR